MYTIAFTIYFVFLFDWYEMAVFGFNEIIFCALLYIVAGIVEDVSNCMNSHDITPINIEEVGS